MARNPWSSLPDSPPFVLADDKRAIEAFNQEAKKNAIIQTEMLPEPFVGSLNAPVFVLLENPGAGGGEEDFALHRRPANGRYILENSSAFFCSNSVSLTMPSSRRAANFLI